MALQLHVPAASPAFAHAPNPDSAYYLCRATALTPAVDGVRMDVARDGSWVRVRNNTDHELVILGYDGEPYLRVGPSGAEENAAAVSSLVNGAYGSGLVTQDAPTRQMPRPPRWTSRGVEPVVSWHDVRTHYDGASRPAVVQSAPDVPHRLTTWHIHALYNDRPLLITGTLDWTGSPGLFAGRTSRLLWAASGVAAALCAVLVATTALRRRRQHSPQPPR